jgi:hypothetical protein
LHFPKCHKKCWWILLLLLALNCFLRSSSNSNKSQVSILAQSQVSCLAKFESKIINTSSSNLYS